MLTLRRTSLQGKGKEETPENLFKVSIITDMHVILAANNDPEWPPIGRRQMHTPLTKIQKFVDHTNSLEGLEIPGAVLNLGDVINGDGDDGYDASFDSFMDIWNNINPSIRKSITAGNHDYSNKIPSMVGSLTKHEYVATKLGYGDRPPIANDKMNETFSVSHPVVNIRFIGFDTNQNASGDHVINGGYLSEDVLSWMKSSVLDNPENIIVFYTHRYRPLMDEAECLKFENMLAELKLERPGLITYLFFGHSHPIHWQMNPTTVGDTSTYNFPAIVDNFTAYSVDVYFNENGIVQLKELPWTWP